MMAESNTNYQNIEAPRIYAPNIVFQLDKPTIDRVISENAGFFKEPGRLMGMGEALAYLKANSIYLTPCQFMRFEIFSFDSSPKINGTDLGFFSSGMSVKKGLMDYLIANNVFMEYAVTQSHAGKNLHPSLHFVAEAIYAVLHDHTPKPWLSGNEEQVPSQVTINPETYGKKFYIPSLAELHRQEMTQRFGSTQDNQEGVHFEYLKIDEIIGGARAERRKTLLKRPRTPSLPVEPAVGSTASPPSNADISDFVDSASSHTFLFEVIHAYREGLDSKQITDLFKSMHSELFPLGLDMRYSPKDIKRRAISIITRKKQ